MLAFFGFISHNKTDLSLSLIHRFSGKTSVMIENRLI